MTAINLNQCGVIVTKQSQVAEQIQALETFAEDLAVALDTIQQHLSSVLRQSLNKPEVLPEVPRELLVPLAEKLRGIGEKINYNINRLREINNQIELSN